MATEVTIVVDTDGTSGDYASLNAAITAEAVDIVTADEQHTYSCQATDGDADTTAVDVDGYTTDADCHVKIDGNDDYVSAITTPGDSLTVNVKHCYIDGLRIEPNFTSSLIRRCISVPLTTREFCEIKNVRIKGNANATNLAGVFVDSTSEVAGTVIRIESNLFYNLSYRAINFSGGAQEGTAHVNNNTISGGTDGIFGSVSSWDVRLRNNLSVGCSGADIRSNMAHNATYTSNNISSDATAPGTNSITNAIVKDATTDTLTAALKSTDSWVIFSDPDNGDYSLHSANDGGELNDAIGAGTDVGLTYDIAGNAWGDPPSIGAFEYVIEFEYLPLFQKRIKNLVRF